MTNDISGFGLQLNVVASNTYPQGVIVTEFADDADPLDIPAIQLADVSMGLNGDLIVSAKATPIAITVNVIPDGDNDKDLSFLAEANRVSRGKVSARDMITIVGIYPDGRTVTFKNGKLTNAAPGTSISSAGRKKTKAYTFTFESKAES